jgi:hypothetical protein
VAGPAQRPGSSPYRFLVGGSGIKYAGVDQGIDFTGPGSVFALGDAVITRVQAGGSGWPGEGAVLNYKLLSGPKAGQYVYVAEDFAPRSDLRPGSIVSKGETIGQATGSGKAPGIEVGWAQPSGIPLAPRPAPRPAPQYTSQGADFLAFVSGGAGPAPVTPSSVASTVGGAAGHIPGVAQVEGIVGGVSSVGDFLGRLTDPSYILRGLQVIAGAVLVLVGLGLLVRQVALSADLPDPAGLGAKAVASGAIPE